MFVNVMKGTLVQIAVNVLQILGVAIVTCVHHVFMENVISILELVFVIAKNGLVTCAVNQIVCHLTTVHIMVLVVVIIYALVTHSM